MGVLVLGEKFSLKISTRQLSGLLRKRDSEMKDLRAYSSQNDMLCRLISFILGRVVMYGKAYVVCQPVIFQCIDIFFHYY